MAPSKINRPNFTIVVNWREKGFGCSKACSYCNWRQSPLLPHGMQSEEAISAFIRQCGKSFITISGGGDPLYQFDENHPKLLTLAAIIKARGFMVRLITREVQHVSKLKGIADYVSISAATFNVDVGGAAGRNFEGDLMSNDVPPKNQAAGKLCSR